MTRRCSHCSNNGHNARTCPSRAGGGVKLFGVRLTDGGSIIKKSASMGNLTALHYHSSSSAAASPNTTTTSPDPAHLTTDGYLSDDPSCSAIRLKKGVAWTEEEHRLFLVGLQKLGKGDWRGISRTFVVSRTPTQVASHAQKYFIRQTNGTRRKRRSSLFDMVSDLATDTLPMIEEKFTLPPKVTDTDKMNSLPSLNLSLKTDYESTKDTSTNHEMAEDAKDSAAPPGEIPPVIPSFVPAYLPAPFPFYWPSNATVLEEEKVSETSHHEVLKPIAILCKEPVNVDELVGMSRLSIGKTGSSIIGPSLSLKLLGESSRHSAFHVSTPPVSGSDVDKGNTSVSQAV